MAVLSDTNGNLVAPANLFAQNSNLLNAAVGPATALAPATRLVTNGDGTTWSFALPQAAAGLPFVTVSAHGIADGYSTLTNSGADFGPDYPGGTDAALWWNAAIAAVGSYDAHGLGADGRYTNSFGGTVYAFPGVFHCQSPIVITNSNIGGIQRPLCLTIVGSGRNTTRIQDDRAGGTNFFSTTDLTSGGAEGFNFYCQGVWFHRTYYYTTNLLSIVALGRLNHWDIADCAFTSGGILTNGNDDAALQANVYGNQNPSGIIGLQINSHYDNAGIVRQCFFSDLAWGIVGHWDHPTTSHNTFATCGVYQAASLTNGTAFPSTNILSFGGAIMNFGEGGGRFEWDHCFSDNAYMVSAWDNAIGYQGFYGEDIVTGTMIEETPHCILDGATNGIILDHVSPGMDQTGLAVNRPLDASGNYVLAEQLTNNVFGASGSYGGTKAWSTNAIQVITPMGFVFAGGASAQISAAGVTITSTNPSLTAYEDSQDFGQIQGPVLTLQSTNGAGLSIINNGTNVLNATGSSVTIPGLTGVSGTAITVAGSIGASKLATGVGAGPQGHLPGEILSTTGVMVGGQYTMQWGPGGTTNLALTDGTGFTATSSTSITFPTGLSAAQAAGATVTIRAQCVSADSATGMGVGDVTEVWCGDDGIPGVNWAISGGNLTLTWPDAAPGSGGSGSYGLLVGGSGNQAPTSWNNFQLVVTWHFP